MPSSSPVQKILFLMLFYFIATLHGKDEPKVLCPQDFKGKSNSRSKTSFICYLLMEATEATSWENAQRSCRNRSSFLLDSRFINETDIKNGLEMKGITEIWIGMKKMAGFYTWQTSPFEIFKETDDWGTKWQENVNLSQECVALVVSSAELIDKNCSDLLKYYVCMNYGYSASPIQNITDISALISQSEPGSILSSKEQEMTLTCEVSINDEPLDPSQEKFISYQWLKNGIPLQIPNSTLHLSFVEDYTKQNSLIATEQGNYQCQVWIEGVGEYVRSEEVEIYFSDVSSYAFVIEDQRTKIPFNQAVDFSRKNFSHFIDLFIEPMNIALLEFAKDNLTTIPSVEWDFQNISIREGKVKLTLELFLNWTKDDNSIRPQDESSIKKLLEEAIFTTFSSKWNLNSDSMSLSSSDFCEPSEVHDASNMTYKWIPNLKNQYSFSDPLCLNEKWQVNKRGCKKDFNGAQWETAPICHKHQDIYNESPTLCIHDYESLMNDWCYKVLDDELSWDEANEACSKNNSYLYSNVYTKDSSKKVKYEILQGIFHRLGEFWAAGKRVSGLFQWVGMAPETIAESNELIWAANEPKDENDCVSVASITSENYTVRSRNCSMKMKFVCMHQKVEISNMPSCEAEWKGTLINNKCYLKVDETRTWEEAKEHCATFNRRSRLLTLPDLTTYNLIKTFIDPASDDEDISWWIGLKWNGRRYEWQDETKTNLTFVDWSTDVNFSEENSAAALTHNTSHWGQNKVKWNLFPPNTELEFICEMDRTKNPPEATVAIKITRYETIKGDPPLQLPVFSCEAKHSLYGSVVWYRNEIAFEGDRGKRWKKEFSLASHTNRENILRSQGYYSCSVEQQLPFKSVKSSSLLFQVKGAETFAATMSSSEVFSELHRNMTRGDFWKPSKKPEIEKELGKILENVLIVNLKNLTLNPSGSEFLFHLYNTRKAQKGQDDVDVSAEIENYFTGPRTDPLRKNISQWLASYSIAEDTINVKSTNACPENVTTNSQGDTFTWPRTQANSSTQPKEGCFSVQLLPIRRLCIPDFEKGAYWDTPEECRSFHITLKDLSQLTINENNVVESTRKLWKLSSEEFDLNSTDIHFIATIMKNTANVRELNSSVTEMIAKVTNNLMTLNRNKALDGAQAEYNSLSIITNSLEAILLNTEVENSSLKIEESALVMRSWKLNDFSNDYLPVGITSDYSTDLGKLQSTDLFNLTEVPINGILAGILLPSDLVLNRSETNKRLNVIVYKDPTLFRYIQGLNEYLIINSPIFYASFGTEEIRNLSSPIQLVFKPINDSLINNGRASCVYVKGNDSSERWSDDGCTFRLINGSYVCYCDHLTNFAVLLAIDAHTMEPDIPLSIVTYIGCGFSIIGLSVTIMTYILFRKWREGNKNKIVCNLSTALLFVLLIFTIGIERTEPKLGCTIIAVLLHYFLLGSFCWMLVEAVDQYLRFVKVLPTYIPRFMMKAMIFAWGLPLAIVTTVFFADRSAYDAQMKYCWLSRNAFFCAFALPVIVLLLINFTIFCFVMHSICKARIKSNQDHSKLAMKRFRAAVCIYFLLGLSWLFGFFAINQVKVVFQYLFAITTTAQGFFIFVFFVFQEKLARQMWLRLFHLRDRKNSLSMHSSRNLSTTTNRKFS